MSSLLIYQMVSERIAWTRASVSGCRGSEIFPVPSGSFRAKVGVGAGGVQCRPLRATVSWGDFICTSVPVWAVMPYLDTACRLIQPNPAGRLNSIDQFGTYSRVSRITKASRRACTCLCVRACLSCVHDSHTGMELLALKHEWLFHGPVEAPCSCLSEQEEKAWSFPSDLTSVSMQQMQLVSLRSAGSVQMQQNRPIWSGHKVCV